MSEITEEQIVIVPLATEPGTLPEATIADPVEVDPLEEMRARVERAEKSAKDSQAWGTKNAQRLAEFERQHASQQREASRPAILDSNPDLADAIRFVSSDPAPRQQAEQAQQDWQGLIAAAHPGIFDVGIDKELEAALVARRDAGDWSDPMVAIRDITEEKIAFAERSVGKRFAVESAKQSQKSAMGVPGSGGGAARQAPNSQLEAVQRIQNMSDADFAKEVRRVKGF